MVNVLPSNPHPSGGGVTHSLPGPRGRSYHPLALLVNCHLIGNSQLPCTIPPHLVPAEAVENSRLRSRERRGRKGQAGLQQPWGRGQSEGQLCWVTW